MTAPKSGAREKRVKRLDPKKSVPLLRESALPPEDDSAGLAWATAKTGVDKEEEEEHHLQLVLKTVYGESKSGTPVSIPIPDAHPVPASESWVSTHYPRPFHQPATLIRFSQPVEEVIGCPYNMDERDDEWLSQYNAKVASGEYSEAPSLTEDQFEELMWGLEKMLSDKQSAGGDHTVSTKPPPTMIYPTLREFHAYVENAAKTLPSARQSAKLETLREAGPHALDWWKRRRADRGGFAIQPQLKMEDNGSNDPYVCFRRREVRPLRKTRRVDNNSLERIRVLRDQMRKALDLADMVAKREKLRREALLLDELVFRQRVTVRKMRLKLGLPAIGEAEQALERPRKKQKIRATLDGSMDGSAGPGQLIIPADRMAQAASIAQALESPERLAEQRVAKQREEDERAGIWDRWIDEAVVVDSLHRAADSMGWRRDVSVGGLSGLEEGRVPSRRGSAGTAGADGQVVPKTPDANDMDMDVPSMSSSPVAASAADKGMAPAQPMQPPSTIPPSPMVVAPPQQHEEKPLLGRIPLARTRIGRGGRVIIDRRSRARDLICRTSNGLGNGGKTNPGWIPGDFSTRGINFTEEDKERGLDDIWRKRRWEDDDDDEDLVMGEEEDGLEWEMTPDVAMFRASVMRDATGDHNEFLTKFRYPSQAYPTVIPLAQRQAALHQHQLQNQVQIIRPPNGLNAQQVALKIQKRVGGESPGPSGGPSQPTANGNGSMSAPGTPKGSLTPKQVVRPAKPEPPMDPKTATVKMLLKESTQGAKQIHQIQADLQRARQQWTLQQNAQANGAQLPVQQVGSGSLTSVQNGMQPGIQMGYAQLATSLPQGTMAAIATIPSMPTSMAANTPSGVMSMPATSGGLSVARPTGAFNIQTGQGGTFQVMTSLPQVTQSQLAAAGLQASLQGPAGAALLQAQVGVQQNTMRQIALLQQQANGGGNLMQQRVRPNGTMMQGINVNTGVTVGGQTATTGAQVANPQANFQFMLNAQLLQRAAASGQLKNFQVLQNGALGQLQAAVNAPNRINLNGLTAPLTAQQIQQLTLQGNNAQAALFFQQRQAMLAQQTQNAAAAAGDGQTMDLDEKVQ